MKKCIAVVLSGGVGTRFGSQVPKQYMEVNGKMIIEYSLKIIFDNENIDGIIVVADGEYRDELSRRIEKFTKKEKFICFSSPGENRQKSILNGLCNAIDVCFEDVEEDTLVMIHDAARPFLTHDLINRCLNGVDGHDGVMPVISMTDTIYMSDDGKNVSKLIDRSKLFAGQAPEFFRLRKYFETVNSLNEDEIMKINGSTEPAILNGLDVVMVPGDKNNIKITTIEDMKYFESMDIE